MPTNSDNRSADEQIASEEVRTAVVDLKRQGKTFQQIGEELGFTKQRAHQLYWETIRETKFEAVATYRAAELHKLDAMERAVQGVLDREHVVVSHGRVVWAQDLVLDEDGHPRRDDKGEFVIRYGAPLVDDGPLLEAVDRLLKIQAARRAILGLDTPVKQQIETDQTVKYIVEGVDTEAMK
ncbi:hypothetical protein [Amycolatopsis sp. NPDC006125]|uniref:hypothetical protein n=1 Tax=Amycolatopsis sp. NPDC006125 TaxID=3156730 RepID=UPI00339DEB44